MNELDLSGLKQSIQLWYNITQSFQIYAKHTENETSKTFKKAVKTQQGIVTASGASQYSAEGTQHSYSEEETEAFMNWIKKVVFYSG